MLQVGRLLFKTYTGPPGVCIWVCIMRVTDLPLSISLLSRHAQPPPLDSLADAEDGGSIDHVLANIQVVAAVNTV